MSLEHNFSIRVNGDSIRLVSVPDEIMTYISDSMYWIASVWNGKNLKNGLPYHGRATIEGGEIVKLKKILLQWKALFLMGTDRISLTGRYLINEKRYEKTVYGKNELIEMIDKAIQLCSDAEMMHTYIIYEGI